VAEVREIRKDRRKRLSHRGESQASKVGGTGIQPVELETLPRDAKTSGPVRYDSRATTRPSRSTTNTYGVQLVVFGLLVRCEDRVEGGAGLCRIFHLLRRQSADLCRLRDDARLVIALYRSLQRGLSSLHAGGQSGYGRLLIGEDGCRLSLLSRCQGQQSGQAGNEIADHLRRRWRIGRCAEGLSEMDRSGKCRECQYRENPFFHCVNNSCCVERAAEQFEL
jgi:hypothetical protein